MAILTLPVAQAIVPEEYNGTSSLTAFNYHPAFPLASTPQTIMARVYLRGIGGGTLGRIFSNADASQVNGVRLLYSGSTFTIGSSSSGASTNPFVSSSATVTTDAFYTVAAVLDGSLGGGMVVYIATGSNPLANGGISNFGSGTGSINSSVGNRLMIGNREDAARTWDGNIASVAWWNRILSLPELLMAQFMGEQNIAAGLVFFYANRRDWGPLGLPVAQRVAIGAPTRVLNGIIPPIMGRRKLFISVPAAASTTMVMDPLVFGGAI